MPSLVDKNENTIIELKNVSEKQFTGRYWFDGRKIYSQAFKVSNSKRSDYDTFNHGIQNVDVIWIKNACFWQKGTNIYYTFGYITSLDDLKRNSSFINVNKNNITYYIGEWLLGATKCDVFVEVEFIEKN